MAVDYRKSRLHLLAYTREPVVGQYPAGLAGSIHFAWSADGRHFRAFHGNYGMLFVPGIINSDNTICPLGVRSPWVFNQPDGLYGIVAVTVDGTGAVAGRGAGVVRYWTTSDFIDFSDHGSLDLGYELPVTGITCEYADGLYRMRGWYVDGSGFELGLSSLDGSEPVTPEDAEVQASESPALVVPRGAIAGNIITVDGRLIDGMRRHWDALRNVDITVPDRIVARDEAQLAEVKATAWYSDGSSSDKRVVWDTRSVDFGRAGEYPVTGRVSDRRYPFPLAVGFGDPVIFPWRGRYYFLGTNDNLDDIGLYVRQADTPEGLFDEGVEQHLILPYDKRRNLIQTFWAPEFHVIGGELYILFAVSGSEWGPQCHVMKLKPGGSIIDPDGWEDPVRVRKADGSFLAEDAITLDMTYLESAGVGYLVWSYREHIGSPLDSGSMLYIATADMERPWILAGEPVLLSRPLLGWENLEGTINNEGPYAFVSDGMVYLTYSGGDARGYLYATGLLTAREGDDLTDASVWRKSNVPVLEFTSVEGRFGPGHNSFFTDPEGNLMIAYHAETDISSRICCDGVHRVHFGIDGRPVFDLSEDRDCAPELRDVVSTVIVP